MEGVEGGFGGHPLRQYSRPQLRGRHCRRAHGTVVGGTANDFACSVRRSWAN
jgi:hypothetical protein